MKRIELHIDRLVLHGVPAAERDAVIQRFQQALCAALAEPGAAQAWALTDQLQGPQTRLRHEVPSTNGSRADWAGQAAQSLSRPDRLGRLQR